MVGIIGYGVYIPIYRLKQEEAAKVWGEGWRGEKSVCSPDEDIVTMAVEAAEKAIEHAGIDPNKVEAIHIATSSSPYLEKHIAPIIAETLELRPEASVTDYCGSLNATALALLGLLDAIEAKRVKCGVVVGTENRVAATGSEGETSFGAGAVALILGTEATLANIEATHSYSTLFTDRWRATSDSFVYDYFDYRFAREYGYQRHIVEASRGVMEKLEKKGKDFHYVVFPQPDARLPGIAARELGIKREQLEPGTIVSLFGDLGCCSSFVGLAAVLDKAKPGETILLASYGSGSSVAISLAVQEGIEKKRRRSTPVEKYKQGKRYLDYPTYLKTVGAIKRPMV